YLPNQGICFNKALRTPDNEIVAVGKASQNYDVSSACFFRFSSAGDTLATAFWPVDQGSQYHKAEAHDLALMDNGNLLLTCSLSSGLGSILEIDINGELVSRINVPDNYANVDSCLAIGRSCADGSFLIASSFGLFPIVLIRVYRLFGTDLTYQFDIDGSEMSWVSTLLPHPNGVLICGTGGMNPGGWLINVSYTGDIYWVWNHEGTNLCPYIGYGFGSPSTALLDLDSDGCVYWAWGNGGQQVITKLLPNGQLPIEDELVSPPVNRISAYPNPAQNAVTIELGYGELHKAPDNCIEIFNIKGQKVRSIPMSNAASPIAQIVWDRRDNEGRRCPTGVYLIRETNNPQNTKKITLVKIGDYHEKINSFRPLHFVVKSFIRPNNGFTHRNY
ncbi:MAG: T9SS type A sorting domain-containing protein, partial [Candidatus Cloacimonetes bacterium]|nr:T9SS type A sorting domain-containing protein [Candidatus Cloacimonadota bacterium]MCK9178572.1 T9SS type A sorting domain-containing protein [Candidatus Cloacimonadota bacterium]